jgi:hypothetical protein
LLYSPPSQGQTGGYDNAKPNDDLDFLIGDQPATCPRVKELHIITRWAPWVTTVQASSEKRGVTLKDVIDGLWQTYVSFKFFSGGTLPICRPSC